jgi:biofilm PGA synthesis lipoprotein PgaB
MTRLCRHLFVFVLLLGAPQRHEAGEFHVLCYHDVRDDVRGYLDADQFAVSTETLVSHLDWLRTSGYRFVTLDRVIAAQSGGKSLPEKSVLLTFDDGYASVYTRVFPILRLYEAPAVVAVVTGWLETAAGGTITYGDGAEGTPRGRFITWEQAREMRDSGLIEFASHSHDLHRSVPCNPLGGFAPAMVTRRFFPESGRYETIAAWEDRLKADMKTGADILETRIGMRPRSIVWPYGETNRLATEAAREAGLAVDFTLGAPDGKLGKSPSIPRILITSNCPLTELADRMHTPEQPPAIRALGVRIADWFSEDHERFAKGLDELMDRAVFIGPNRVLLDPYERDAQGRVTGAFYPSDLFHRRPDLANRFTLLLASKCAAEVVVAMPEDTGDAAAWAAEICQWLPIHGIALSEETGDDAAKAALAAGRRWRPELKLYRGRQDAAPGFSPFQQADRSQIAMATLENGAVAALTRLKPWLDSGARHCGAGPLKPGLTMDDARNLRSCLSAQENPYRSDVTQILRKNREN